MSKIFCSIFKNASASAVDLRVLVGNRGRDREDAVDIGNGTCVLWHGVNEIVRTQNTLFAIVAIPPRLFGEIASKPAACC